MSHSRRFAVPLCGLAAVSAALALTSGARAQSGDGAPPASLAADSLRAPLTNQNFYFVMTDRFANGDTSNDLGGLTGAKSVTGFDPTSKGYYHGGDIKGLESKLDYIKGLGTTALWITPPFKNRYVQGSSAGYHGYWITDFTQVDPHFGTNQDLADLVAKTHAMGMKIFLDIVVNHTADVIKLTAKPGGPSTRSYVSKATSPYRDAAGNIFNDRDYIDSPLFPALNVATSFPFTPSVAAADAHVKQPEWLNDLTLYHNRAGNAGNAADGAEEQTYGDFSGLDDLFTENPRVVDGMIDIFKTWVDFGVDGFRIDSARHVDTEFWQKFSPAILQEAHRVGTDQFFMFGEVFDTSRPFTSIYTTTAKLQSVLDFPFQAADRGFASQSQPTSALSSLFADDDWYTDADSNVYELPTFLGNHDMGRIGQFIRDDNPTAPESELLRRDKLANELMYFSRGNPVVLYGDEQGFTGVTGGDQNARQDMFPSLDPEYDDLGTDDGGKNDDIGSDVTPAADNFDTSEPLYEDIAALAKLTQDNPALRNGAEQPRYSTDHTGIFAFSRTDATAQREYIVALNNSATDQSADVPTYSAGMPFHLLYGTGAADVTTTSSSTLHVTVPALSTVVYEAAAPLAPSAAAPAVHVSSPAFQAPGRIPIQADVAGSSLYEVTFAVQAPDGSWTSLGTDDNAPYRVFYDASRLPLGTHLRFAALVKDNAGHVTSTTQDLELAQSTTATGSVGATVPATLALTLGAPATFGPFTAGIAKDYLASLTANVISTAGDGALSVTDPSATAPGHLVNGSFALAQPLQAKASSASGSSTGDYTALGAGATPLLTYVGPTSNDAVTLGFKQSIAAGDALRTGSYAKTLVFTLSTTTP
jgi:alpha-amylase